MLVLEVTWVYAKIHCQTNFSLTVEIMNIKERIFNLQQQIHFLEAKYYRAQGSVLLLAVSKSHSISAIEEAKQAGLTHFAENYWQEMQEKILALRHLPIIWHFIGALQSNKTEAIAQHVSWVHSIDRSKIAQLLSDFRPQNRPPLQVCLQVNLDEEKSKQGVPPSELQSLAQFVSSLPNLKLRGLMAIPKLENDSEAQYESFLRLKKLQQFLNEKLNLKLDTLSMGMSSDLAPAIQAGSTIVRVGRAIFGERK